MLNLMPNRINSFGKLKCTQRPPQPRLLPSSPSWRAPFCGCLRCLACTHNFSSAPRLSLPTSFVNCTHLTRTHPFPIPCLHASLYLSLPWWFAVPIIFAQFPTLFNNLCASSASTSAFARKKSLHKLLTIPTPSPHSLSCHALLYLSSECAILQKNKKRTYETVEN